MDIIFLHGLHCDCTIGVWDWEKQITQTVKFDIDLGVDTSPAAQSDKLEDALDYNALAQTVIEFTRQSKFDLIETLAEKVAQLILDEFDVKWLRIKLDKGGAVKNVKQVGVIIERESPKS